MSDRPSDESGAAGGAAPSRSRWRWRPYPFEIAAWASLAAAVLFLRGNGLRIDWNTVVYTVPPRFLPTAQVLLAGPPLYGLYLLLRRRPVRPYLRRLRSEEWQVLWLRLLAPEIPQARDAQEMLWRNYQTVVAGRDGGLKRFNPTRGIAAMPSLHVGGHWLLLLWIRRRARPWLVPAVIGTGLTLIGSVVTGWHYAVDGYVGIGIAWLAYWAAWRLDPQPDERAAGEPPASAEAPA